MAIERSIDLNRRHHYSFIALMEPFRGPKELEQYRRKLRLGKAGVNALGKIWYFF